MKNSIKKLTSFQNARKTMLSHAYPVTNYICLPIVDALGCITSESLISPIDLPSFNSSAMDGYAIKSHDMKMNNLLKVCGDALAGKPFIGNWPNDSAISIMTGAQIPKSCEAVIKQEDVKIINNNIFINKPVILGQNIRLVGEDIKIGDVVIDKGVKLGITELSLIASLGIVSINVVRKLRVAIFSTGDELQYIGKKINFNNKLYDINRFAISLMLKKLGCEVIDFGIIKDNINDIRYVIKEADISSDIVITTGSLSVGKTDFMKTVLEEMGRIIFWKVAIKPGKPFAFGHLDKSWFIGLPGNSVSAIVTFYQLAQPFISKCQGQNYPSIFKKRYKVRTATNLKKSPGFIEFQRGYLVQSDKHEMQVCSTGVQNSHFFSSFTKANCFIILGCEQGNVKAGDWVEVEPFNMLLEK
ncbi:molybdopterin molybdotransferase [Candidatus Pantoea edessiphila]|uniref:Molybdopterin molybdenumtransferase n=1 Tax=Candidatus Pantoea edessiphila TaxID=2044610 RepID=A0A2P5SYY0_9GAMM|nr:molybdopterin molybdotransferase MoeA [Candidatus Pantoea edessiphila]MBK4775319.1 molybdopterin molybdotransferase MoeA [Pantoea sp. Edef]PPI87544.1 molybdopterin molybdotransferase [Candidatus Pantoea edessiphila]